MFAYDKEISNTIHNVVQSLVQIHAICTRMCTANCTICLNLIVLITESCEDVGANAYDTQHNVHNNLHILCKNNLFCVSTFNVRRDCVINNCVD